MTPRDQVIQKFSNRDAHIAVIGLGYVGLPLCVAFAKAGYRVTGIDVDSHKVEAINSGESYIEDIPSELLESLLPAQLEVAGFAESALNASTTPLADPTNRTIDSTVNDRGFLQATTNFSILNECDAVSICVPTPLNKTGDPNLAYIAESTEQISQYLHSGMVIVLESTTYPGTTTEIVLPLLEENNPDLVVGEDFFLAFSPERIDPGRVDWTVETMPKVMGGITPSCFAAASAYYEAAIKEIVRVSSPDAAEMTKLFENTFRSVNIGLANELLLMCDKLGLDAWEILDAAATKPFGFMKFTPGPGLGGHCIPVDPHYLSWKLRSLKYNARFIELASEVNTSMPAYWVQKAQDKLNNVSKAIKGSKVLVLGVAYKKDVSDLRESPSLDIIHLLEGKGAQISYHDPYVSAFSHDGLEMVCVEDLEAAMVEADCVIIATDHSDYEWEIIKRQSNLLVDTRHVTTV
mgnify:CR=1 FL=1